ncbi:unnamed protein product [Paramecium sonneborni]|uniref:Uncharacterized protein n=1 Tax=Paramecium sonneborni TaxID=65129 RepID=A0A8S1JXH4_9CILI|nr:unnamed protein product [Paramecium sonneborni]
MQEIFKQFLIFKQIDQINLQEYCFYALDKENHLCFIYIDGDSVEIEVTEFELNKIKKLSQSKIEYLANITQNLEQIFSEIQPQDEQEKFCSLSLDQIFVNKKSNEIIVPKFIKNQLQQSKQRNLFIQNFFYNLKNHFVENEDDLHQENIENIIIMKKIIKKKLDLNDKVCDEIKQLFETFLLVSIEKIKTILIFQNGYYDYSLESNGNDYKAMKQFYQNYLIDRQQIPDEDLKTIEEFFITSLLPKNGNLIQEKIIEIKNYCQNEQQGLRLQANKMYDICKQEFNQKQGKKNKLKNEERKQGLAQKEIALVQYVIQHSDVKLKQTDVLINLNWPYISGKPDALIYDNKDNLIGLIQVKSSYKKQEFEENENFDVDFIVVDQNKVYSLKKDHKYYYQVQVNLLITELGQCIFMVSTKKGNREIIVRRDEALIKQIIKKQNKYYFTEILPSICKLRKYKIEQEDLIRIKEII